MKVYVDELPEKCEDCVFSETGFVWDSEVRFCKLKPRCMNWIALSDKKRKDCNLCSLADYTKQVRKEVVQEIKQKLVQLGRWDIQENGSIYFKMNINTLNDILDKFEQGE